MSTVPCPVCDEPLDLDAGGGCQRCRANRLKGLRPLFFTAFLLVAAAAGYGWWRREALTAAWNEFNAEVERARNPGRWKAAHTPPPAPAPAAAPVQLEPAAPGEFPAPRVVVSSFAYFGSAPSGNPDPATAQPPAMTGQAVQIVALDAVAVPPAQPADPEPHMRRLYGVVYDLMSLRPVAGAVVSFKSRGQDFGWSSTTDGHGHYQADLFLTTVEAGMLVSIKAPPGFREGLLEDKDPPMRQRPLSARRTLAKETTADELDPIPLRFGLDQRTMPLDLLLLPAERKD